MHTKNQNRPNMVANFIKITAATVMNLRKRSFEEVIREIKDLTGNTRFQSISVLLAFFHVGMCDREASKLLGYVCVIKKTQRGYSGGVVPRANQINTREITNLYSAYKTLKRAGLIKRSLRWLLDPGRVNQFGRVDYSQNRIKYSKRIVREMVIAHGNSRRKASLATNVPLATIRFWREY